MKEESGAARAEEGSCESGLVNQVEESALGLWWGAVVMWLVLVPEKMDTYSEIEGDSCRAREAKGESSAVVDVGSTMYLSSLQYVQS